MKLGFIGLLIALVGAFVTTQGSKLAGPILVAVGLSCMLIAFLG